MVIKNKHFIVLSVRLCTNPFEFTLVDLHTFSFRHSNYTEGKNNYVKSFGSVSETDFVKAICKQKFIIIILVITNIIMSTLAYRCMQLRLFYFCFAKTIAHLLLFECNGEVTQIHARDINSKIRC